MIFIDKSVSFEKSVSFSDEPPDMSSPKQHSPQHAGKWQWHGPNCMESMNFAIVVPVFVNKGWSIKLFQNEAIFVLFLKFYLLFVYSFSAKLCTIYGPILAWQNVAHVVRRCFLFQTIFVECGMIFAVYVVECSRSIN